jgi:phosphate-selective porin OprO/OprP
MEYDFANQLDVNNEAFPTERDIGPLPAITDAWVQIRELPILGIVRIGNQKDPFGYEHLTSSRWLNFMERSFTMDAFVGPFNNGFQPGIKILNASDDGRVIWQVGEFKNTSNVFGASATDGGSQTVGRLVVLPVFEGEGERLVHLGVAGRTMGLKLLQTEFDPATGLPTGPEVPAVRFRSRGDVRNGPPGPVNSIYADAGLLEGSWQNMIGLEFVGNDGPLSWQAEYIGSWLYDAVTTGNDPINAGRQPPAGTKVGTVFYQGGYVEVLYFLTGETRTYSRLEGVFDRPIPRDTFYVLRGARRLLSSPGAWQVGARYNCLSLNDGEVNGGVLNAVTLGLNWLWTPNARVYFNYDFTYRDFANLAGFNGSGGIHAFGTRLAFDF